jgi:hypothetical protein
MALAIKKELSTQILVAGGGFAGVASAIAAARNGAKVILCQNRPILGGNASSEIRMHIGGADAEGARGKEFETEVREGGIIEEIRLECAVRNPQSSPSMQDLILYEKCLAEPNLTLLLNTEIVGVSIKKNQITSVFASRPNTEDEFEITASIFIDCTGDGRMGAEAGAEFMRGREGVSDFNESRANQQHDNMTMGNSLLFMTHDMGRPMSFTPPKWAKQFTEEDLKLRNHCMWEYGYWWIEYGGIIDTIKDGEEIRNELIAVLMGIWDHIKNSGNHPESANWALEWFGFLPGKRESRRFVGHHILTQNDLEQAAVFTDAIAYGGWSMDTHPPQGIYAKEDKPCDQPYTEYIYSIPLSSCVSRNIKNLMFAGRNISATHIAFASTRVMATCALIGQGVGTAAAIAIHNNTTSSCLINNPKLIFDIQQLLLQQGVYLPGVKLKDNNLAKIAKINASSEKTDGLAINIIDGQTRSVHGKMGVQPELTEIGTHRWMSQCNDNTPWIELEWQKPVDISKIVLVLDTGMHRPLMMTHVNALKKRTLWQAQPETLRDFDILSFGGKKYESVLTVRNNYQRQLEFSVNLKNISRLCLEVFKTNGSDSARLFEIRCYG